MTELRYLAPTSLDEAIGAFAAAGSAARILAGVDVPVIVVPRG